MNSSGRWVLGADIIFWALTKPFPGAKCLLGAITLCMRVFSKIIVIMAAMLSMIETVISLCMQHSGSEDLSDLDFILMSISYV